MFISHMGRLHKICNGILLGWFRPIERQTMIEFTVEVRRPHRVDRPTVNMPNFSMTMVRFRMHMEKWNCEHPKTQPEQYRETKVRGHVTCQAQHA